MRKPTDKQFAKAHPELAGKHVDINKHSNGVSVYVRVTEDLTFDEKGRVLTQVDNCHLLDESLNLVRPYGKETQHVHTYTVAKEGDFIGCVKSFMLYGDKPMEHKHTVRGTA